MSNLRSEIRQALTEIINTLNENQTIEKKVAKKQILEKLGASDDKQWGVSSGGISVFQSNLSNIVDDMRKKGILSTPSSDTYGHPSMSSIVSQRNKEKVEPKAYNPYVKIKEEPKAFNPFANIVIPVPNIVKAIPNPINAIIPAPNTIAPTPVNIIAPKAKTAPANITNPAAAAITESILNPANKLIANAKGINAIPKAAIATAPTIISAANLPITNAPNANAANANPPNITPFQSIPANC